MTTVTTVPYGEDICLGDYTIFDRFSTFDVN